MLTCNSIPGNRQSPFLNLPFPDNMNFLLVGKCGKTCGKG